LDCIENIPKMLSNFFLCFWRYTLPTNAPIVMGNFNAL
jgi:hypothetical protein